MNKKHILICDDDLKRYPPIISIINILLDLSEEVIFLGFCSDIFLINKLKDKGLVYESIDVDKVQKNNFKKFLKMFLHKKSVLNYLKENSTINTLVWVFGNENGWRMNTVLKKYKSILYLFEFPFLKIPLKYRIVVPFLNLKKSFKNPWKVVCCENNRAQITRSYFNLSELPTIIPNKPYSILLDEELIDIKQLLPKDTLLLLKNKKIILYQGAINIERRVDLFCQSIEYLSSDYIICIMGANSKEKEILISKYKSKRVVFIPFIAPPLHLKITSLAYIGVISYNNTDNATIENTLNFLYCAPNKIFEYSKFSIPMISNNLPALKKEFSSFNAGICFDNFSAKEIATTINKVSEEYDKFSKGAKDYYNSVNIKEIVKDLIN